MTHPWRTLHPDTCRSVPLPALGHLPAHEHLFAPKEIWAVKAALGARRPLLVRGEPGTGKSELARAAAALLGWAYVSEVVTARTEPADLHWRFDAVARLARAQLHGAAGGKGNFEDLAEWRYVSPSALWWVFDREGAEEQWQKAFAKGPRPAALPEGWAVDGDHGTVLLIDEIDKADPDLPNGLLESLGNGEFQVPHLGEPVRCSRVQAPPLIVITTNEERELPAAFVRRCLVLQLGLPEGEALKLWLAARGRAHFGEACAEAVCQQAAELIVRDRAALGPTALLRPGQAEYLDLLRAVIDVSGGDPDLQQGALEQMHEFVLLKNAPVAG